MRDSAHDDPRIQEHLRAVQLRPLPGSAAVAALGVESVGVESVGGALDDDERLQITLILRRLSPLPEPADEPLSPAELAAAHGADPADIDLVGTTLSALGLRVTDADPASRRVRVEGPLGRVCRVFGAQLRRVRSPLPRGGSAEHRALVGGLSVPAPLDGVVVAVLGLDDRPQARPLFHIAPAEATVRSYTPPQVGAAYDFPPSTDGTGQVIALIELGGGYRVSDLAAYFARLGIPTPRVTSIGVDGAANAPTGDANSADGEVVLDIEVAGSLAPASAIVVYFAPNTDAGFVDAVSEAAHADVTPTAISISWGQSEDQWTAQARTALDDALADAALLGVTVTVAAGDGGSPDRADDHLPHCDFPASSPHALACGGTALVIDPTTGETARETVWNDPGDGATGGGVSDVFPLPVWQTAVGVPARAGGGSVGRGVPDIAGNADPRTGYQVLVDGQSIVVGGTSAVAPLWAALIARLAQAAGSPFGLLQPRLYAGVHAGHTAPGLRDITSGGNGAYTAGPGWDACTGLGVPVGTDLLARLGG